MPVHYNFRKGQKVRVILKDKAKSHIVGKFEETKSGVIIVDGKRISLSDVRSVTIDRSGVR
jgi:hypothetical protein